MLVAKLLVVSSELDNWENGCTGEYFASSWEITFTADNQGELIQKMLVYFRIQDRSHLSLNSCDEAGRIDVTFNTLNKFDTCPIDNDELERFKRGEISAYLTTFTFYVRESKPYFLAEELSKPIK